MKRVIYWLRNDLRIHDNKIFDRINSDCEFLLPVYILDSSILINNDRGFPRMGKYRLKFLFETLSELKLRYQNYGSDLHFAIGKTGEIIPNLAKDLNADTIFATKEHTEYELKDESDVSKNLKNAELILIEQLTLTNPEKIPFEIGNIPDVFTNFRKAIEKSDSIDTPISEPHSLPGLPNNFDITEIPSMEEFEINDFEFDARTAIPFSGGEISAMERLNYYLYESRKIEDYKYTRNGLIGEDYSSKFSPWLANGSLSPRQIYHAIKNYERSIKKNISTYWLVFELLWRDYFRYVSMKYGNKIFAKGGIKNLTRNYSNNIELFHRWINGETEDDFVNANMIELKRTGFMSNRGRQNAASYLVHDLNIDWRWGAEYFESMLIDYDACSNWGNWMYIAGVGNDPRPNRKFNTQFQAEKYDKNYDYRNLWLNKAEIEA